MSAVLKAEPTRHTEVIKEELKYLINQERMIREGHDVNGRPAPDLLRAKGIETVPQEFPTPFPGEQHPEKPRPAFGLKR